MSTLSPPAQADAAGTMEEVEDLVKRFGHYSQWVGEAATSDDLDRISPTRLEARDDLLSAFRTIVTERDESFRRHAITTKEACDLAEEVGRLRAENAELRAGREVPAELVALSANHDLATVETFRRAAGRWVRTLITTTQGARHDV